MKYHTPFYKTIIIFIITFLKLYRVWGNYENHSLNINGFHCPPGTYYTPHPYYKDCTKYIECYNGQGYIKNCSSGTAFDKNRLLCDDISKVKCGDTYGNENKTTCPSQRNNQKDFYPFSPTKYTICLEGQILTKDCDPQKFYSITQHLCLPKEFVPSHDRVQEVLNKEDDKIYCPNDIVDIFPYPFSNQLYIKCVYGELIMKQCRPSTFYNFLTKFCEPDQYNTITQNVNQPDLNKISRLFLTCPFNLYGQFLHPFDCTKYIVCTSQGTEIKCCPYNHIYSFRSGKCLSEKQMIYEHDLIHCMEQSKNIQVNNDNGDYLGVYCSANSVHTSYPHPRDWRKYVVCENNVPKVMLCPKHKVFSIETRKCQLIDEL